MKFQEIVHFLEFKITIACLGHEKQKPCFTRGAQIDLQVGSVGQDLFLKYFFFLVVKMTYLKNTKNIKKIWFFFFFFFFWEKFKENILSYFPNICCQIFVEYGQKRLILHNFRNLKKKLPIWKNWVGHTRKTGFSFFVALLSTVRFVCAI